MNRLAADVGAFLDSIRIRLISNRADGLPSTMRSRLRQIRRRTGREKRHIRRCRATCSGCSLAE